MKAFNLDRHWNEVCGKVSRLANKQMFKGVFQRGELTEELEQRICKLTDRNFCATYGSGTAALTQGLRNLNLPKGTEVLVPAYTWISTVSAISLAGLKPVFCEVDAFYHIDLAKAESKINSNTRVLLYVTLLGNPAVSSVGAWCKVHDLLLVEDAAQSFGAPLSDAVFSMLSFSPTKPCTSFGSGGAIVTNNAEVAELATLGRLHGKRTNSDVTNTLGINSVMSTHEVASVLVNLDYMDTHQQRRKNIASTYYKELAGVVEFARYRESSTYSKYVIRHKNRDNMPGTVHYPVLPPTEKPYQQTVPEMAAQLQSTSITLPNCAYMTNAEVEQVIEGVKAAAGTRDTSSYTISG